MNLSANIFKSKNFSQLARTVMFTAVVGSLTACGANETQDGPLPNVDSTIPSEPVENLSTKIAGAALNGYVANSLVWIDLRDNDSIDGTEPVAYTDAQGYFTYNPITGVDYCASENTFEQQFCLETGFSSGLVELKVAKGVQVLTGTAFNAVLTTTVDLASANSDYEALKALGAKPSGDSSTWQQQVDAAQVLLSPLATVAHYLPENMSLVEVVSVFGVTLPIDLTNEQLLQTNFLEGLDANEGFNVDLYAANMAIHYFVNNLVVNLDASLGSVELGFDGLPLSTADGVYAGLAAGLVDFINSPQSVSSRATNNSELTSANLDLFSDFALSSANFIIDNLDDSITNSISTVAQNILSGLVGDTDIQGTTESSIKSILNMREAARSRTNINVLGIIDLAEIASESRLSSSSNANSQVRRQIKKAVADVLALISEPEVLDEDSSFIDAVAAGRELGSSGGTNLDLNAVTTNIAQVVEDNDSENSEIEEVAAIVQEQSNPSEFELAVISSQLSVLGSKHLSLSGVQNGDEQGQLIAFFQGDSEAKSGDLVLCVAYSNPQNANDNVTGLRFTGSWANVGSSQNRISLIAQGFTVQMNITGETRGSDIPAEEQGLSGDRNPNELYGKFAFTLNEVSASWHSDNASINQNFGLRDTLSVPANSSDCAEQLTLQVD